MAWEIKNDRPVYIQLLEELEFRILNGTYTSGTKLLSVRDLAGEAQVNPNTMQKALSELEKKGLISSKRTSGNFITEDKKLIDDLRTELASNEVGKFCGKIKKLGITKEQTIELINKEEF